MRVGGVDEAILLGLSEVLTVSEVAAVLRVDRKTIYDAIRRKQLPAKRVGRRRLVVPKDALVAWLRS